MKIGGVGVGSQAVCSEVQSLLCHTPYLQTALQLLEKSVHEKQDHMVALRKQLEETKQASLKMSNQLKVYGGRRRRGRRRGGGGGGGGGEEEEGEEAGGGGEGGRRERGWEGGRGEGG